jgi:hypothetical protein
MTDNYEKLDELRADVDEQLATLEADAVNGESAAELLKTARKLVEALEALAKLDKE